MGDLAIAPNVTVVCHCKFVHSTILNEYSIALTLNLL